jgi:hypothetical protein
VPLHVLVGMHIFVSMNKVVYWVCLQYLSLFTEGMLYHWVLHCQCYLMTCQIIKKSIPVTTGSRFGLHWIQWHLLYCVCFLDEFLVRCSQPSTGYKQLHVSLMVPAPSFHTIFTDSNQHWLLSSFHHFIECHH